MGRFERPSLGWFEKQPAAEPFEQLREAPLPTEEREHAAFRPAAARPVTPERPAAEEDSPKRRLRHKKERRKRPVGSVFVTIYSILMALLLLGFCAYLYLCCVVPREGNVLTSLPARFQRYMITNSRESHSYQWVQYFFPPYIRQPYVDAEIQAREDQIGFHTEKNPWEIDVTDPLETEIEESTDPADTEPVMSEEQLAFYELFYELDQDSMEAYIAAHPSVVKDGYGRICINEAGLDDEGTDIYTTKGEQVLAIDAYNQVLLVRVTGDTYRGVLATAKDPSMLHLYVSAGISNSSYSEGYGQVAGKIAEKHNGLLAITASGFTDEGGVGTGGAVAGYCRSDGKTYGFRHREYGCKRLELREDNWLYLCDIGSKVGDDVTDYMEFEPGMVADGQRLPNYTYTAENPRACVGQTDKGEILMLAIEGRQRPITGCSVSVCADIMIEHRCVTAMNMDGGTSAMLWYDGEPVIRCSNKNTPQGRYLPNAWVYVRKD